MFTTSMQGPTKFAGSQRDMACEWDAALDWLLAESWVRSSGVEYRAF